VSIHKAGPVYSTVLHGPSPPNRSYRSHSPIVEINVELYASSENRNKIHVLPTPESPISSNLNKWSYVFAIIINHIKMFLMSCLEHLQNKYFNPVA